MATMAKKRKVVASPRTPGIGSLFLNLRGEKETIRWDGEDVMVYIEPRPEHERVMKQQSVNPQTGEKMWKEAPKGMMPKPRMELVETIPLYVPEGFPGSFEHPKDPGKFINPGGWREYIIDQGGNGANHKNFHFRPDPKFAARIAEEARRKAKLDKLLDRLAENDMDPEELAAALPKGNEAA